MFFKKVMLAVAVTALALPTAAGFTQGGKEALRISGSTTVLPIAQKAAELYQKMRPELALSVSGTGSGDGLKALTEGGVDIANSSRDLKTKEKAHAAELKAELKPHAVALDCVAVIVHPENPIASLSLDDLKGIYTGRYKNWSQLGGADKPIVAINRDPSSGTFEVWLEKVLQGERVRPDAQVQASNGAVAQAVAGNKYAIGYVGLGYLRPAVKALAINDSLPSVESVRNQSYPISRELYMFTRGDGSQAALDFIDFILSQEGQKMVEGEGFVPIKEF